MTINIPIGALIFLCGFLCLIGVCLITWLIYKGIGKGERLMDTERAIHLLDVVKMYIAQLEAKSKKSEQPEPPLQDGWWYKDINGDLYQCIAPDATRYQFRSINANPVTLEADDRTAATLADLAVEIDGADVKKVKVWFVDNVYSITVYKWDTKEEKVVFCNREGNNFGLIPIHYMAKHSNAAVICEAQWESLTEGGKE